VGGVHRRLLLERPTLVAVVSLIDVRRAARPETGYDRVIASPARVSRPRVQDAPRRNQADKLVLRPEAALAKVGKEGGVRVTGFSASDPRISRGLWREVRRVAASLRA